MTVPDVSIVVPTHNRWHLLAAHALPSALNQLGVEIEVIVVDDGSTDETPIELGMLRDPRIRALPNTAAAGVAGARNTGIAAARGTWVAFLDDDDHWSPSKLRKQLDVMGSAVWGFAGVIVVDEALAPLYDLPLPNPREIRDALRLGNVIPGGMSNVICRTSVLRRLGGLDEGLSHSADWDLWLGLAEAGEPAVTPEVLVATVEHANRMLFRDRPDIMREAERLFAKHGGATSDQRLAVAEWLAGEHRRNGDYLRSSLLYLRAAVDYRSPGNLAAAVGALFGERGLRTASAVFLRLRGRSHLAVDDKRVVVDPPWLREARLSTSSSSAG
jgi:glycosyltransferase involved in cell wall biosynthesis